MNQKINRTASFQMHKRTSKQEIDGLSNKYSNNDLKLFFFKINYWIQFDKLLNEQKNQS